VPAREGQASVSPARLLRSPALGPADAAVRRTSGGGLPLPEPRHRLSARPRNGSVGSHRARPSRQQALVVRRQEQSGACPDRGSPLPEPRRSLRARSGEGGSVRATWFPLAAFPCGRPSKGSSVYILLGACSQRKRTYGLCTASIESAKDDTRSGTSEKPTGPSGSGSFSGPACPLGRNGTFGYREARAACGRQRVTGVQASHDRYGLRFHRREGCSRSGLIVRSGHRDWRSAFSGALPTRAPAPNPSGGGTTVRSWKLAAFGLPPTAGRIRWRTDPERGADPTLKPS
jgi:hypothetical protein